MLEKNLYLILVWKGRKSINSYLQKILLLIQYRIEHRNSWISALQMRQQCLVTNTWWGDTSKRACGWQNSSMKLQVQHKSLIQLAGGEKISDNEKPPGFVMAIPTPEKVRNRSLWKSMDFRSLYSANHLLFFQGILSLGSMFSLLQCEISIVSYMQKHCRQPSTHFALAWQQIKVCFLAGTLLLFQATLSGLFSFTANVECCGTAHWENILNFVWGWHLWQRASSLWKAAMRDWLYL